MSYLNSLVVRNASDAENPPGSIMPNDTFFQSLANEQVVHHGLVDIGERSLPVSSVYSANEGVMDRRK